MGRSRLHNGLRILHSVAYTASERIPTGQDVVHGQVIHDDRVGTDSRVLWSKAASSKNGNTPRKSRSTDGTRTYLHAVIGNVSRRILACHVAGSFAPVNSVPILREASQHSTSAARLPVVLADAGVENANAQVDALIATADLRRLLALTELTFSNSMIEAWWRSLKHHWPFLHSLDSVAALRWLVAFYGTHTIV